MAEGFIKIEGLEQFKRAAAVLRETGGGPSGVTGDVRKMLLSELRAAGRPVAAAIKAAYQERMPQRGGLADRLGGARIGVRNRLTGSSAGTSIVATVPGWDLEAIESGTIRHPVYGNRSAWVSQEVPAHVATEAFEGMAPEVEVRVNVAVEKVIASVEARIL